MARLPTTEQIDAASAHLETYFTTLGKVAHEWNHMQEELNKLFCEVTGLNSYMGHAVWHALKSDKSQRDLLEEAIQARAQDEEWNAAFPRAEVTILGLLKSINRFSEKRNAAIHAPCNVVPGEGEYEIYAYSFSCNKNAKKLRGKDILGEFDWYERTANTYRRYARDIHHALSDRRLPWPDKPQMPTLGRADSAS